MSSNYTKLAIILSAAAVLGACKSKQMYSTPPTVRPYIGKTITAPPGMVYIPAGTILERSGIKDSLSTDTTSRRVSLSAFFMDATEVSNMQYRRFVDWVADSIAVTDFIKDPRYFYDAKVKAKKGTAKKDSVAKRINWSKVNIGSKVPLWQSIDPVIASKVAPMSVQIGDKRLLKPDLIKFAFLRVQAGGADDGKDIIDTVKVVPNSNVWSMDFPNSQSDIMKNNYFTNKAFNNYPVVGVNWKQARAYAFWRGIISGSQDENLKDFNLKFNLPTEAQWEYAASGGENNVLGNVTDNIVPSYKNKKSKKDLPLANFKQGEGSYTKDGSTYTLPVKSYAPNIFGLYNMEGNVAEWTLDAYSPSAREFVDDLNPALLYDAPDNDVDVMKRKVVRGGSWKDNAEFLNAATRNYEVQDVAHSYIGFRCVMSAPDLLTDQVKTRKPIVQKARKSGSKVTASSAN
jgi:sulfatase modifying factor 1